MAHPYDYERGLWTTEGEEFLINEDAALKALLQGITVSDSANPARPVQVWFGLPDKELREQSYPFITIELIDINLAEERNLAGLTKYVTQVTGEPLEPNYVLTALNPVPWDIDYQITAYSRNPRHDRQIISQLLTSKLPGKYGGVYIEADSTKRRLTLLSYTKRDRLEDGRKTFTTVFNVRVSSEISNVPSYITPAPPVETVSTDVTEIPTN